MQIERGLSLSLSLLLLLQLQPHLNCFFFWPAGWSSSSLMCEKVCELIESNCEFAPRQEATSFGVWVLEKRFQRQPNCLTRQALPPLSRWFRFPISISIYKQISVSVLVFFRVCQWKSRIMRRGNGKPGTGSRLGEEGGKGVYTYQADRRHCPAVSRAIHWSSWAAAALSPGLVPMRAPLCAPSLQGKQSWQVFWTLFMCVDISIILYK